MDIIYDKPFKTYDELIELLISRKIIIDNVDFAKRALCGCSYYALVNGYKNTFLSVRGSDDFVPGTKFEDLYTLYLLDTSLNQILFKYILHIERSLKSKLTYLISEKYGVYTDKTLNVSTDPSDYLYKSHYSNSNNKRSNILYKLRECLLKPKNNASLEHYLNDKNHVPAWILSTNIPFGLAIEWYSILKSNDKTTICNQFVSSPDLSIEESKEFLSKALMILREYRNKIAHGNKIFSTYSFSILPKKQILALSYGNLSDTEYNKGLGQNDLLSVLYILIILSDDTYIPSGLINDCNALFCPYINSNILINGKSIFEIFNLPEDIFERLSNILKSKYDTK